MNAHRPPRKVDPVPVTDLVLAVSRHPLANVDPLQFLGVAAREIARGLAVRGAVLVVPAPGWVHGSDSTVTLLGEIQHRDGQGPVSTSMRTLRPMLTPDLTRIGPPALAALADEAGLMSSVAVAVTIEGAVVAALQLVGLAERPVGQADVDAVGPLCEVLGARIVDLIEFARLNCIEPSTPPLRSIPTRAVPPPGGRTAVLRAVMPRALGQPTARSEPVRLDVVPEQAVRPGVVRVAAPDRVVPVRRDRAEPVGVEGLEFVPVPLTSAPPELVTEEMRAVDRTSVRRAAAGRRARHRRA